MKNHCKIIVSLLLTIVLSVSCIPMSSVRAGSNDKDESTTVEEQDAAGLSTKELSTRNSTTGPYEQEHETYKIPVLRPRSASYNSDVEMSSLSESQKGTDKVDNKTGEETKAASVSSPSGSRHTRHASLFAADRIRLPSYTLRSHDGDTESQVSSASRERRKSCFSFASSDLTIPDHILKSPYGIIKEPVRKRDIKLSVNAPASIDKTPGVFNISVKLDSYLEKKLDDVSVYVQFSDDTTEFSFAPPVPVIKDVELLDSDQYSYNINVTRIYEDVNRAFFVYVTHKDVDINGEKREYLIAAHRQQVHLCKSTPNKAVIIVPGICGSELFSAKAQRIEDTQYSKGYRLWPPEGIVEVMDGGVSCCIPCRKKETEYVQRLINDLSLIFCKEDGSSKAKIMRSNPILDCKSNPDKRNFGTINCYSGLVNSVINSEYARDAKVVFFSYDWRISNAKTAKELEKFIKEQEYSEVILVAHSMGGLVCSSYLSNPKNCEKVSKMVFLGTPFLGAAKAFNALENGVFFDGIVGDLTAPIANPKISALVKKCASVYELLPPKQFFEICKGASCRGAIIEDRGYVFTRKSKTNPLKSNYALRTFEETSSIIESREWTPQVNKFLKKAQRFHDSLYDKHGTALIFKYGVPIFNIVGCNIETHAGYFLSEGRKNKISCKAELCNGDGTVSLLSSTLMGNVPNLNSYYVKGINHMGLMQNPKCLELINNIISGHVERFDPRVIEKIYPRVIEDEGCCGCLPLCICF